MTPLRLLATRSTDSLACVHFGKAVGHVKWRECGRCGRIAGLYECALLGQCTYSKTPTRYQWCGDCAKREPPGTPS